MYFAGTLAFSNRTPLPSGLGVTVVPEQLLAGSFSPLVVEIVVKICISKGGLEACCLQMEAYFFQT